MDVILTQDVRALGKKGEKVKVSDGYARNFLFPKNLAKEANASNLNVMQSQQEAKDYRAAQQKAAALEQKAGIDGKSVTLHAKAGANGKIFGAITGKEIAEALEAQYGIKVDKKKIVMSDNIKNYGSYSVDVKLYPEIAANITVQVTE